MQRRKFLKNASFLGLGLVANPALVFGKNSQSTLFAIPSTTQVRHGLFSLSNLINTQGNWLENLQHNRFFYNGFAPSDKDLILYSFVHKNSNYQLGIKNNNCHITTKEQTKKLSLDNNRHWQNEDFTILFNQKTLQLEKDKKYYFLPTNSNQKINKTTINEGQILRISSSNQKINFSNKTIILIQK
jgi:hypothetical protein